MPGKKNSKFIAQKSGRSTLITKPEYQKQINAAMEDLLAGLRLAIQTEDGGITGTSQRRSTICSFLPEDDCWTKLPETCQTAKLSAGEPFVEISLTHVNSHVV